LTSPPDHAEAAQSGCFPARHSSVRKPPRCALWSQSDPSMHTANVASSFNHQRRATAAACVPPVSPQPLHPGAHPHSLSHLARSAATAGTPPALSFHLRLVAPPGLFRPIRCYFAASGKATLANCRENQLLSIHGATSVPHESCRCIIKGSKSYLIISVHSPLQALTFPPPKRSYP